MWIFCQNKWVYLFYELYTKVVLAINYIRLYTYIIQWDKWKSLGEWSGGNGSNEHGSIG